MKKGLVRNIVMGGLGLATAFIMGACKNTYNIDGSIVTMGPFARDYITENKGNDNIRYIPALFDNSIAVVINGKAYDSRDTLIYEEAVKRYNYLFGKIDSIRTAESKSKLKEKLEEKKAEEEKALWVIRK